MTALAATPHADVLHALSLCAYDVRCASSSTADRLAAGLDAIVAALRYKDADYHVEVTTAIVIYSHEPDAVFARLTPEEAIDRAYRIVEADACEVAGVINEYAGRGGDAGAVMGGRR